MDDYGALEERVALRAETEDLEDGSLEGSLWADEIILAGAKVLAVYDAGWMAGMPAITANAYGKGKVVYVGTVLPEAMLNQFVAWLCEAAGVTVGLATPEGVRAYERRNEELRLLFLLNFGQTSRTVMLDGQWQDAFTQETVDAIDLEPAAVKILQARD